jgi:hypothetical protein
MTPRLAALLHYTSLATALVARGRYSLGMSARRLGLGIAHAGIAVAALGARIDPDHACDFCGTHAAATRHGVRMCAMHAAAIANMVRLEWLQAIEAAEDEGRITRARSNRIVADVCALVAREQSADAAAYLRINGIFQPEEVLTIAAPDDDEPSLYDVRAAMTPQQIDNGLWYNARCCRAILRALRAKYTAERGDRYMSTREIRGLVPWPTTQIEAMLLHMVALGLVIRIGDYWRARCAYEGIVLTEDHDSGDPKNDDGAEDDPRELAAMAAGGAS